MSDLTSEPKRAKSGTPLWRLSNSKLRSEHLRSRQGSRDKTERELYIQVFATEDIKEGGKAFVAKRPPKFKGK